MCSAAATRATGQVFREDVVVGDEAAQVDDAPDVGIARGCRHVRGGGVVGFAETRLTNGVHQVVNDVNRLGRRKRRTDTRLVARIHHDGLDIRMPAETLERNHISRCHHDVLAIGEQSVYQA
jgi:hypothetical protein